MKRFLIFAGVAGLAAFAGAAGFQNGSFEFNTWSPTGNTNPGQNYYTLGAGSTDLNGWVVDAGSIDLINSYWQNQDGNFSLDMSGNDPAVIHQTFDTVIGQTYLLSFYMSGNPDHADPAFSLNGLIQGAGTDLNQNFNFNTPGTLSNMNWTKMSATFTASATSSTLWFTTILPPTGPYGPALDNVSIQAVPEPFTVSLSLAAAGLFVRRRLRSKKA